MGSLSDYIENGWLDHIFENTAYTQETELYVGLSTADPADDASGITEQTIGVGGYSRQAIGGTSYWGAASSRSITNSVAGVTFSQATADWSSGSNQTHWFICNHATNTTWGTNVDLIAHGTLTTAKAVLNGNTASFGTNEFTISVNASGASGGMTDALVHEMLDHTFKADAGYSQISIAVCLATAVADGDAGSWTEVLTDSNAYARVDFAAWDAAASGTLDNTSAITFTTATGSWGTITHAVLTDNVTYGAGTPLFWANITDQAVTNDDTVEFGAGDFDVTIT
ncbi:MAG: phage tail fiber protein [Planctomycetota bacterium]|jgi:hypothetical protein